MNTLKQALLNNARNIGRNVIIGFIIFVICLSALVTFAINESSNSVIMTAKDEYQGKATISLDIDKVMSSGKRPGEIEKIAPEFLMAVGDSEYVEFTSSVFNTVAYSEIINAYEDTSSQEMSNKFMGSYTEDYLVEPTLSIVGTNDFNMLSDFIEENKVVVEGEFFANDNEVIISQDLADLNNLTVNDVFTVGSSYIEAGAEFEIVGIYENYSENTMPSRSGSISDENIIYTTKETTLALVDNNVNFGDLNTLYNLHSSDNYEAFVAEVEQMGLIDEYQVSFNEISYNAVVSPLESMKSFIDLFMLTVFIVGSLILLLVTMLVLRERKYEIGVLRAIGMKKGRLMAQFITENVILAFVVLAVALPVGALIDEPVANAVLANTTTEEIVDEGPGGKGRIPGMMANTPVDVEVTTNVAVAVSYDVIIQVVLITFILIVISSIFSLSYITKFEPITILSDS